MTTTTTINRDVERITRAQLEEVRWLARELLAEQVAVMQTGGGLDGAFADLGGLVEYARALGCLGTDLALFDFRDPRFEYPPLPDEFSALSPLAGGAEQLEESYRFDAADPSSGDGSRRYRKHAGQLADRIAHARVVVERLLDSEES